MCTEADEDWEEGMEDYLEWGSLESEDEEELESVDEGSVDEREEEGDEGDDDYGVDEESEDSEDGEGGVEDACCGSDIGAYGKTFTESVAD